MQSRNRPSLPLIASLVVLVAGAVIVIGALALPRGTGDAPPGDFAITLYPQPTPTQLAVATPPIEQPTVAITPVIEPTATPRVTQYVVQQNDTLWDITIKFGLTTLDSILAVNPGLNPDFLSLGQVIQIPGTDFVPPPGSLPTAGSLPQQANQPSNANLPTVVGQVMADAGGLRLRESPTFDANVITKLGPNTQLQILGQVAGQNWLKVITPNGTQGYVDAQYVSVGQAQVLPAQPAPADALPAPVAVGPLDYPFLSDISPRVQQIFQTGQARGNRPNALSVVGDSNSQHPAFLKPFDWGNYSLGSYTYLQGTVDYFRGSFAVDSPASIGGFNTGKVLDPGSAPGWCNGQSPLMCEYNRTRPSVALILLGTGDQHEWQSFESRYRQIVQTSIDMGVIPILITKPDDLECRDNSAPCGFINGKISALAYEFSVPLLNLRQVVERLPNGGTTGDGFHFSFPPGDKSAWLTNEYLQYGYNQRNLTALQTLDVLRRKVLAPSA